MLIEERKYSPTDYEGIIDGLLQSEDFNAEFRHIRSVIIQNPLFFPLLFKALDNKILNTSETEDRAKVSALEELKAGLMEFTNVVPADLPDFILRDRQLYNYYLQDFNVPHNNNQEWAKFKEKITDLLVDLPKSKGEMFLNWCIQMLEMNLSRHRKTCRNPICGVEGSHERRLLYINEFIAENYPKPIVQNSPLTSDEGSKQKEGVKMQWLGTQKELAELFIRLKAKGWIADFEAETIKTCFTNANSIQQLLKPGAFTEDLGGTFEQVFTPEYSPKFHGVMQNPKPG